MRSFSGRDSAPAPPAGGAGRPAGILNTTRPTRRPGPTAAGRCGLILLLAVSFAHAQDPRADAQREQARLAVAQFEADLAKPGFKTSTRNFTTYAHYLLLLGGDPAKAVEAIRRAFRQQRLDPADPLYGHVEWKEDAPVEQLDKNGIAFTLLPLGPILLRHRDKLPPGLVEEIRPNILAGLEAMRRRDVDVAYTNIYLMDLANRLLLGEALGLPEHAASGREMLEKWMTRTTSDGIGEYGSPTYAAVQLGCLETAWRHTGDPAVKERLALGLRWLWSDIAANFFAGRGSLSGPHSRSADFLNGRGSIERYYGLAGLSDRPDPPPVFGDAHRAWTNAEEDGFRPDEAILSLARLPERMVRQRYGPEPGRDRSNFITPDFAVGSASASYSPDDRQIVCELASDDGELPPVRLIGDSFDSPYGGVKLTMSEGHRKTRHLTNRIAAVQERGMVMALLDWDADSQGAAESVATNFLLPLKADAILLDGKAVTPEEFSRAEVTPESVVAVRQGDAVVALRIFAATGARGTSPLWFLKADGPDGAAGRFGVYHYRGREDRVSERPVRAGVFLAAATCRSDDEVASFLARVKSCVIAQSEADGLWTAQASLDGTTLEAGLDLTGGGRLVRRINGTDYIPPLFEVNGRDLAAEITAPAEPRS